MFDQVIKQDATHLLYRSLEHMLKEVRTVGTYPPFNKGTYSPFYTSNR